VGNKFVTELIFKIYLFIESWGPIIYWKLVLKNCLKVVLKMMLKCWFIDDENGRRKIDKNRSKMTPYKFVKKRPKNGQNLICHGGVKIIKNRPRGPRTLNYKFFEISALFAKAPPFSTPKIDPQKGPYWKCHSPQIGCAFAPMGGSKKSLFGGSEGGPLGPKIVDTTI
jgi:hypothetical protein